MATRPRTAPETAPEADLDRAFIEAERNRFAGRALSFLIVLNGAAALILLFVMAQARESTVDGKVAAALLFFASGAIAALLSAFLAYINRTVRMRQSARRENLRAALRGLAIAASIGSGAAFLVGCDVLARTVTYPMNLPINVITSAFGCPAFFSPATSASSAATSEYRDSAISIAGTRSDFWKGLTRYAIAPAARARRAPRRDRAGAGRPRRGAIGDARALGNCYAGQPNRNHLCRRPLPNPSCAARIRL